MLAVWWDDQRLACTRDRHGPGRPEIRSGADARGRQGSDLWLVRRHDLEAGAVAGLLATEATASHIVAGAALFLPHLAGVRGRALSATRPPEGVVLLAEVEGEPVAAIGLFDGQAVSDPARSSLALRMRLHMLRAQLLLIVSLRGF
jgi:hypothetical protein